MFMNVVIWQKSISNAHTLNFNKCEIKFQLYKRTLIMHLHKDMLILQGWTLWITHIKFNADTFGALENDFIQKYALLSYFWLVLIFLKGCYLHIIQSYYTFFHSLKEDFLKCLTSYQNGQRAEKVFFAKKSTSFKEQHQNKGSSV